MSRAFNLIDEPWIRVLNSSFETEEVSLKELFEKAHTYRALAGETEPQDIAVLRFLLSILYSVFARYGIDGELYEMEEKAEAIERWQELWEMRRFPAEVIYRYLEEYRDRFWLFDEERPFFQVNEAKVGTYNSAAKLNGNIAESNNKVRMFSERSGIEKERMSYPEAARWLLYINGFDDTSAKPKGKNLPSPGAGWLGRLGIIYARGNGLFETLLLNLTFLKDGETLWEPISIEDGECACWELQKPRSKERTEITIPENLAALYTLQSRRIYLDQAEGQVSGYFLLGGDFFERENAFNEQMTLWRMKQDKNRTVFTPRRHDPSRQIWREFASITDLCESNHRPGIVSWLNKLNTILCIADDYDIHLQIVSVQYGDKDFFVTDSYSDSISLHSGLLGDIGKIWREWVKNEIQLCDNCAYAVKTFAEDLKKASGDSGTVTGELYQERFYSRVDPVFRDWLVRIDPKTSGEEYVGELRNRVKNIAVRLGKEMVDETGQAAFRGRYVLEKKGNDMVRRHYSSPEAYNIFLYKIKKTYERS